MGGGARQRVKAGENGTSVDQDLAERKQKVLAERRFFIESRLTMGAVVEVFRQRDKILIDSGDLPGKRQLFLIDPDLLRMPSGFGPKPGEPVDTPRFKILPPLPARRVSEGFAQALAYAAGW